MLDSHLSVPFKTMVLGVARQGRAHRPEPPGRNRRRLSKSPHPPDRSDSRSSAAVTAARRCRADRRLPTLAARRLGFHKRTVRSGLVSRPTVRARHYQQVIKNHLWSDLYRKCWFLLRVEIDDPTSEAHFFEDSAQGSAHEPVELVGVSRKSAKIGSPGRTRTCDLVINSHPLYRLSYRGVAGSVILPSPREAAEPAWPTRERAG